MKHFKLLYLKEVRGEQDAIIGYVTMIMAFMAVMFVIALRWPGSSVLAIANLPAALLPLWFIYASFDILSREWREKNIALLSSIPVQTHHVLGAKLAVVWTEYLFLSLLSSGTLLLITLTAGIPVSFPATFSEITGFIAGPFLILLLSRRLPFDLPWWRLFQPLAHPEQALMRPGLIRSIYHYRAGVSLLVSL